MRPLEPTTLKLATFAVPLSGNKGSASMLLGLRDACAAAGLAARCAVFSYYPRRDAELAAALSGRPGEPGVSVHPGHPRDLLCALLPLLLLDRLTPALVPRAWRPHLAALRESDVVLVIGGTTFADSMLHKVPWNVLAALPGFLLGKPTMLLSQTLGPARNPLNRLLARWVLRRAVAVHGRGRTSREWARRLGVPGAGYRPDLSFSLAVPAFEEVAARWALVRRLEREVLAGGRPAVAVVPNAIVHARARRAGLDYPGFLAEAIRTLDREGFAPVLLPHCWREEEGAAHNNDRGLCAEVLGRLSPETSCFHLDADLPAGDLRAVLGRLHLVVASRFHAMVSSLAMGVPPITYGWGGHKYLEVLAELGVSELYAEERTFDPADFLARLRSAHARREELSRRILTALAGVREQCAAVPGEILAAAGAAGTGQPVAAAGWLERMLGEETRA